MRYDRELGPARSKQFKISKCSNDLEGYVCMHRAWLSYDPTAIFDVQVVEFFTMYKIIACCYQHVYVFLNVTLATYVIQFTCTCTVYM